ncbi:MULTISPECIES: hypothetical protein [unclassified Pseudoxanthomonas]|uniref:hypothetical protein n=1 Tax=unclassified Pseudoxanthomonas TaxID=2645906 RepID=UPI0011142A25|nr:MULTISPECIES: hypothetical protein [unclassified Pseudoxanthomonas]
MGTSDLTALRRALSLFHDDERGCHIRSQIFDLEINYRVNSEAANFREARAIRNINHDLWQISALMSRLVWMREMTRSGDLHEASWRAYSQLDIEHYYVQVRSALDYLAVLIAESAPKRGQLPTSFRSLRESIEKYEQKIHPKIASMVSSAHWFDELRAIRDSIVHDGAQPMVFSDGNDWLLFQVHGSGLRNMVSKPFMLHNENVAYFDRFVAWSFSHALSALDCVGSCLSEDTQFPTKVGPVRSYGSGFSDIRGWMKELLQRLETAT